jgi:hypothetical protein
MRFFVVLGCALAVANGLSLQNAPKLQTGGQQAVNENEHDDSLGQGNNWGTSDLNDSGDINETPFVRQHGNMWQGVVPNYAYSGKPGEPKQFTNLFAAEGEAKAWVYSKTGAEEPLMYALPQGADGAQDSIINTVEKEGTNANSSNNKNDNVQWSDDLESPIIDKDLAHTQHQSYHDTYDHMSTIVGSGTTQHGETHETKKAKNAVYKAKRAAEMSKAVSGRAYDNGGNDKLTKAGKKKTQGAKDASLKKSKELNKLGASHPQQPTYSTKH